MEVNRLWRRRAEGYLRDCVGYLGIAALGLPLGLAMKDTSMAVNPIFLAVASSVPAAAATWIAARSESGAESATWGKRRVALAVSNRDGGEVAFGRALWRNTVKIFLPWSLGHIVAFGAANGGFERADGLTLGAAGLVHAWCAGSVMTALYGTGRSLHDRLSGTSVSSTRPTAPAGSGRLPSERGAPN